MRLCVEFGCGFKGDGSSGFLPFEGEGVIIVVDAFVLGEGLFGFGVVEGAFLGLVGFGADATVGVGVIATLDFDFKVKHPTSIIELIIADTLRYKLTLLFFINTCRAPHSLPSCVTWTVPRATSTRAKKSILYAWRLVVFRTCCVAVLALILTIRATCSQELTQD